MATRAASAVRERDGPGALFAFAVLRRMISLRAMSDSYNKPGRGQCTAYSPFGDRTERSAPGVGRLVRELRGRRRHRVCGARGCDGEAALEEPGRTGLRLHSAEIISHAVWLYHRPIPNSVAHVGSLILTIKPNKRERVVAVQRNDQLVLSRVVAHGRRAWYARGDDLCLLTRADTGHAAITHAARVLRPVGGYHDAIVPAFDAMLYPNDGIVKLTGG